MEAKGGMGSGAGVFDVRRDRARLAALAPPLRARAAARRRGGVMA